MNTMATSPTPSLDSLPGANSIGSFCGEHNDFLSDSPLTLSGSSPPVSDSAICDDFSSSGAASSLESHPTNSSSSSSSASSTSSTSGLCLGSSSTVSNSSNNVGVIGSNLNPSHHLQHLLHHQQNTVTANNIINITNIANGQQLGSTGLVGGLISGLSGNSGVRCTACKTHEFMHCFDGHNVFSIQEQQNQQQQQQQQQQQHDSISMLLQQQQQNSKILNGLKDDIFTKFGYNHDLVSSLLSNTAAPVTKTSSSFTCSQHDDEIIQFFCRTCNILICKVCIQTDHPASVHEIEHTNDSSTMKQTDGLINTVNDVRTKVGDIMSVLGEHTSSAPKIKLQYQKAHNDINETYQFFHSMLDERKHEVLKELESFYKAKNTSYVDLISRSKEFADKVITSCDSVERMSKRLQINEINMWRKNYESKLQTANQYLQELQSSCELEFVSNYQAIQVGVRNTFGYIRSSAEIIQTQTTKQPPIARPTNNNNTMMNNGLFQERQTSPTNSLIDKFDSTSIFDSNIISKRFNGINNFGPFVSDPMSVLNPYEKWSNGGDNGLFNGLSDHHNVPAPTAQVNNNTNVEVDLTSKLLSVSNSQNAAAVVAAAAAATTIYPPKSQIKRQKMIYHCKFGEFGVMEGQFTEPSGVAVNAQNDIIVADTNNHRIQIFDKEGRFKFQFGECGKRDGQLLYPNRVAVVKTSGDIIVTERSPTHQIQIYNQYGQFVRKFGANILQHPRGVTVDNKGRIIVVECKVMRVIIFDQNGNVIQKFGCSKHLEFPNGVVVNDKQEIFISDNRAHCVKVFNYEGQFLRQIGGEGVTNYPIGVGINTNGEILIADNHNNFNLTIFTQDGQLVSALESKVKHAQCFDVALMDDGSVVLASKDYRLYIYRYVQVPPIGL
ncbi:brat family protein [Megaselia abdita]